MKRILAVSLGVIMLAIMTGCATVPDPLESAGNKNSIVLTIAENLPSRYAFEYKDGNPYCFYAFDAEYQAYRIMWADFAELKENDVITVDYKSQIKELNEVNPPGEWSVKYELEAINVYKNSNLVWHINISSGDDTIYPFGCLLWSKTDNGNGTYSETHVDKYDVIDLVNGKTPFSVTEIPKIKLNDSLHYLVQANGMIEKVYLLSSNGREYSKTESSFEELSKLKGGIYYVVLEVLLSGNCDPDSPQNSYRYEDVFRLIVG